MTFALAHAHLDTWSLALIVGFVVVLVLAGILALVSRHISRVSQSITKVADRALELEGEVAAAEGLAWQTDSAGKTPGDPGPASRSDP